MDKITVQQPGGKSDWRWYFNSMDTLPRPTATVPSQNGWNYNTWRETPARTTAYSGMSVGTSYDLYTVSDTIPTYTVAPAVSTGLLVTVEGVGLTTPVGLAAVYTSPVGRLSSSTPRNSLVFNDVDYVRGYFTFGYLDTSIFSDQNPWIEFGIGDNFDWPLTGASTGCISASTNFVGFKMRVKSAAPTQTGRCEFITKNIYGTQTTTMFDQPPVGYVESQVFPQEAETVYNNAVLIEIVKQNVFSGAPYYNVLVNNELVASHTTRTPSMVSGCNLYFFASLGTDGTKTRHTTTCWSALQWLEMGGRFKTARYT